MIDLLLITGTAVKDFLASLLKPLQTLTDAMELFNNNLITRAYYNGQKMVLQKALNEIFTLPANTIIIENNQEASAALYTYNVFETSPLYFSNVAEANPVYTQNIAEVGGSYDFLVKIPSGIYSAELNRKVIAETNLLKLTGTRFITESV
jgi:hypothetical protein